MKFSYKSTTRTGDKIRQESSVIASQASVPSVPLLQTKKRRQERIVALMEDTLKRLEVLKQLQLTIKALQQETK